MDELSANPFVFRAKFSRRDYPIVSHRRASRTIRRFDSQQPLSYSLLFTVFPHGTGSLHPGRPPDSDGHSSLHHLVLLLLFKADPPTDQLSRGQEVLPHRTDVLHESRLFHTWSTSEAGIRL